MKKIRVRNHRVVLNRSKGGDFGINIMLLLIGAFMFIPMIYSVMNAFKPLEEFFYFPPHFFPRRLTLENFTYLFQLMSSSWVRDTSSIPCSSRLPEFSETSLSLRSAHTRFRRFLSRDISSSSSSFRNPLCSPLPLRVSSTSFR